MANPLELTREDWVRKGFDYLADQSGPAVVINQLARALGVTKGSFYWHFTDTAEFKLAAAQYWKATMTDKIVASLDNISEPDEQLFALAELLAVEKLYRYDVIVRLWSLGSKPIANVVNDVDKTRLHRIAATLAKAKLGLTAAECRTRARILASYGPFEGLFTQLTTRRDRLAALRTLVGFILTPADSRKS